MPKLLRIIVAASVMLWCIPLPAQIGGYLGGANITVQLPTFGVAIDADGVLQVKSEVDPTGRLRAQRLAASQAALPRDIAHAVPLRKLSLVRLEREINQRLAAGKPLDEMVRCLAGLQQVKYVFCYPGEPGAEPDIVIAGPAEGWLTDGTGRVVGATSGAPVLLLEDLLVALRAYRAGTRDKPFIGCTIDPTAEGLARFVAFQRTIPHVVARDDQPRVAEAVARGVGESLGLANIRVFGISPQTHFAEVLIEADYRMKLIGIGLEPPPVKMTTFIGALGSAKQQTLQRWWFTPNYECVRVSEDRLAMSLEGEGVQLLSEDKVIGPDGKLLAGGKASEPSDRFTTAFTRKYPEIARRSPVFAQLRNEIGLLIAAAFLRREDYYGRAQWHPGTLLDEESLPTETLTTPRQAPCAVNPVWKGDRLLAPAGGGVSIQPDEALAPERLLADRDGKLAAARDKQRAAPRGPGWWWD